MRATARIRKAAISPTCTGTPRKISVSRPFHEGPRAHSTRPRPRRRERQRRCGNLHSFEGEVQGVYGLMRPGSDRCAYAKGRCSREHRPSEDSSESRATCQVSRPGPSRPRRVRRPNPRPTRPRAYANPRAGTGSRRAMTLGPLGRALRLNCWLKKRHRNRRSHFDDLLRASTRPCPPRGSRPARSPTRCVATRRALPGMRSSRGAAPRRSTWYSVKSCRL